jgi:threonine-phosphate decarboxylase
MCICNPHSPSGTLYGKQEILDLVDFCSKKNIIFSVDENYIEFAEKGQDTTLAGMVKEHENLFVIRSVTKFFGMPGIRLGYGIAAPSLVNKLENVRLPWSINGLAGYATLAAFKDTEFIENTKRTIAKEKAQLAKNLSEIECLNVYPSVTNFLLVKILNRKITSTKLKEMLAKEHVMIRDCCTFMGLDDSYFRITVRSAKDNEKLVEKIKQILENV